MSDSQPLEHYIADAQQIIGADRSERANADMALVIAITNLAQAMAADFESTMRAQRGITWSGFRLLFMLRVIGPSTPSALATRLSVKRPSVTSLAATLHKKSLIERTPATRDRRSVELTLTESGEALLTKLLDDQNRREHDWTEPLTLEEVATHTELTLRLLAHPRQAQRRH